jgi:hypothetical protein
MKENKGTLAAVAALLPALIIAATGWMEADAQKAKKFDALDSYRAYIEDRMERDDALERALQNCMALLPVMAEEEPPAPPLAAMRTPPGVPDVTMAGPGPEPVDLDELAEEFGYEQKVAPE